MQGAVGPAGVGEALHGGCDAEVVPRKSRANHDDVLWIDSLSVSYESRTSTFHCYLFEIVMWASGGSRVHSHGARATTRTRTRARGDPPPHSLRSQMQARRLLHNADRRPARQGCFFWTRSADSIEPFLPTRSPRLPPLTIFGTPRERTMGRPQPKIVRDGTPDHRDLSRSGWVGDPASPFASSAVTCPASSIGLGGGTFDF
jgi:hypothetical protein